MPDGGGVSTVLTRGTVVIDIEACKGCDLCIDACPPRVLEMTTHDVNSRGYRYPRLKAGCTGCRFFAGYPMTPFTEILEHMAAKLPEVGGVCMNAESELEAVGMAWGAAATGTPAATGSTGQGLSLMLESISEAAYARLPLVVLNMARAQGDYFQAT